MASSLSQIKIPTSEDLQKKYLMLKQTSSNTGNIRNHAAQPISLSRLNPQSNQKKAPSTQSANSLNYMTLD